MKMRLLYVRSSQVAPLRSATDTKGRVQSLSRALQLLLVAVCPGYSYCNVDSRTYSVGVLVQPFQTAACSVGRMPVFTGMLLIL